MFKRLHPDQSLFSGSDLWVITFDPDSFWFKKINWYCRFTIQKTEEETTIKEPLLISTSRFLPNQSVLCLPKNQKDSIQQIYNYWGKLNKPSLRIFLDNHQTEENLENVWMSQDSLHNLTYVQGIND